MRSSSITRSIAKRVRQSVNARRGSGGVAGDGGGRSASKGRRGGRGHSGSDVRPWRRGARSYPDDIPARSSHKGSERFPSTGHVAAWCAVAAAAALFVTRFDDVLKGLAVVGDIVGPLLAGAAIAYVLNLVMERWEAVWFPGAKQGPAAALRRPACLVLAVATLAGIVTAIVMLVHTELADAIAALWQGVISAALAAGEMADAAGAPADSSTLGMLRSFTRVAGDWQTALANFVDRAGGVQAVATSLFGWGGKFVGGLVSLLIAVVFALYLLAGKEAATSGFDRAARLVLPRGAYEICAYVVSVANECFSRFIFGQVVEAIVLGCLCAVGMAIFRMPYAATVGLVVGVGALIPYVGAWTAGAIGALIVYSVDPMQAVWFLVFLVVLQQLDGHFVYPNVVGVATGVSSIWVLVAVFAGGSLFGLAGVVLSVPIVATCQRLVGEWADRREVLVARRDGLAAQGLEGGSVRGDAAGAEAGEAGTGRAAGALGADGHAAGAANAGKHAAGAADQTGGTPDSMA